VSVLLYAITDRCHVSGLGMADEWLRSIPGAGLAAIVSDDPSSSVQPTHERMWKYEEIVEALMDRCTILPARFGTWLEDDAAVRALLHQRRDEFVRGLARVRGTVEMGVSAHWIEGRDGPADGDGESGTAYMLGRLATLRSARAIAGQLEPLLELSRTGTISMLPRAGVALTGAYLVARSRAAAFADECDRLGHELRGARLACTGPWPPYSFARGDGAE
jgi:hypothetical protein